MGTLFLRTQPANLTVLSYEAFIRSSTLKSTFESVSLILSQRIFMKQVFQLTLLQKSNSG